MSNKHYRAVPLSAETIEALKSAPRYVLEALPIIAARMLTDIGKGLIEPPPKEAETEHFLALLLYLAECSKLLKSGDPMPEQPVDNVDHAADLLKKFTLH